MMIELTKTGVLLACHVLMAWYCSAEAQVDVCPRIKRWCDGLGGRTITYLPNCLL
jgi:hypothetical protein